MKNNDDIVEDTHKLFKSFIGDLVGYVILVSLVGLGLTVCYKLFLG